MHVHKCQALFIHIRSAAAQPITQGTNPIYKEGIQDTIHMRETRFGPRSIARVLAVASGPRAWSAVAHRRLPPPPASEREQTKQINRKPERTQRTAVCGEVLQTTVLARCCVCRHQLWLGAVKCCVCRHKLWLGAVSADTAGARCCQVLCL